MNYRNVLTAYAGTLLGLCLLASSVRATTLTGDTVNAVVTGDSASNGYTTLGRDSIVVGSPSFEFLVGMAGAYFIIDFNASGFVITTVGPQVGGLTLELTDATRPFVSEAIISDTIGLAASISDGVLTVDVPFKDYPTVPLYVNGTTATVDLTTGTAVPPSAVPEPVSFSIIGIGLGCLALVRRRWRVWRVVPMGGG